MPDAEQFREFLLSKGINNPPGMPDLQKALVTARSIHPGCEPVTMEELREEVNDLKQRLADVERIAMRMNNVLAAIADCKTAL